MLGFAPFPLRLGPHQLGLVFTGWVVLVALGAVYLAPRLQARLVSVRTMGAALASPGG